MFIAEEGTESILYIRRGELSLKWCSLNLQRMTKPEAGLTLQGEKQQPLFHCRAKKKKKGLCALHRNITIICLFEEINFIRNIVLRQQYVNKD